MKKVTIYIKAETPEDVVSALDDIKQAILLGNKGYKSQSGKYEFVTDGQYAN